ncbi:MAG: hypothetical protein ACR2LR_04740 [Hassallia sp.]
MGRYAFLGKALKTTGIDKLASPLVIGLVAGEGVKHGIANPLLEMAGIKKPSYVPPPAMSQYEEIMLGQQQQPGLFGFGGQQRTQGLVEKRAMFDMDQQRNQQVMSDRIARMQVQQNGQQFSSLMQNNSPLEMTRVLADRDRHAASQNALASMSGAMANSMTGNQSMPTQIGYSNTSYAPQYNGPPNMGAMQTAAMSMRGGGRRGRYGVDMRGNLPPGMPMTPELRDQMQYSPEQMGQFSGRGGAIARGYDSAKLGYVDNMVPQGVEQFALEQQYGQPSGTRRRRARG